MLETDMAILVPMNIIVEKIVVVTRKRNILHPPQRLPQRLHQRLPQRQLLPLRVGHCVLKRKQTILGR